METPKEFADGGKHHHRHHGGGGHGETERERREKEREKKERERERAFSEVQAKAVFPLTLELYKICHDRKLATETPELCNSSQLLKGFYAMNHFFS